MKKMILLLLLTNQLAFAEGPTYNFNFYNKETNQTPQLSTGSDKKTETAPPATNQQEIKTETGKDKRKSYALRSNYSWATVTRDKHSARPIRMNSAEFNLLIPLTTSISLTPGLLINKIHYPESADNPITQNPLYQNYDTQGEKVVGVSLGLEQKHYITDSLEIITGLSLSYSKGYLHYNNPNITSGSQPQIEHYRAQLKLGLQYYLGPILIGVFANAGATRTIMDYHLGDANGDNVHSINESHLEKSTGYSIAPGVSLGFTI